MKFKITKEALLNSIDTLQNIINTKTSLPILSNILIETYQGKLRFTATDLNIGITCVVPVDIQEPGAVTIPARRFGGIIRELSEEKIEITTKKNHLMVIDAGMCQFKIMGLPAEDFPKLPEMKDKEVLQLEQGVLKEMLRLTSFAVSFDETRYILNGILFKFLDNTLTLVATDAKRLAVIEKKLPQGINKELQVIIPIKTIQELNRNLKDEGMVSMIMGANQVLFDFGDITIISRLIEGEFPSYQQVIPPEAAQKIKASRDPLLLAVRRAALLSTPDYQAIKMEVFKEKLVVSKSTPDVGESREELAVSYAGKEMVIGFNPNFLIDLLKNITEETIELEITGSESPGVIRSKGYVYIVLPMRLG
ncbi:MAG: DNA polymerase III subunit beta [Candidatus Omnitrophota bacterium]|nr:MAG: DNA polymerase III subunit beta [Candidatus Omnitrophota bacterium]